MLSFCQNKVITTGEGGAVVTDSRDIYEKLQLVRSHGRQENPAYINNPEYLDYITLGYNFRMPDVVAALGISQIKKTDKLIAIRRKNAKQLTTKLKEIREIIIPTPPNDYFHVYQMYTIKVKRGKETRDNLIENLATKGITTKVYFLPVHLTRFYKKEFGYKEGNLPITEKISGQVLSLPLYPTLTKEEINYVFEMINNFFKNQ